MKEFLLIEVSYLGSSHQKNIGYFNKQNDAINWLKRKGYVKNNNFKMKELWEHPKDVDYEVWKYVVVEEINMISEVTNNV